MQGGPHACHAGEWITTTTKTRFVYDGPDLLGEYESNGTARQEVVWRGDIPVAVLARGRVYYVDTDQLGAPRALTDANGTAVWRWDPRPFGDSAADEDPDGDGSRVVLNLRFPGQYYDAETGKYYNYYRYYDSSLGRYVQSDPAGLLNGVNLFVCRQ